MPSSVFCPIETRSDLENAAAALMGYLNLTREEAFRRLLGTFGILCEHVEDTIAEALARSLHEKGMAPLVKDDAAVLRPPKAEHCLGFQVRASLFRVFRATDFEDIPRSGLLLISCGKVVVRRAATAPRKQGEELKTIFHAGAGARGASPEAGLEGAAIEQHVREYIDLYVYAAELHHFRVDREEINYKACLEQPGANSTENFRRFFDLLERYCGNALKTTDRVFHSIPDFDRYNKFMLNYPG